MIGLNEFGGERIVTIPIAVSTSDMNETSGHELEEYDIEFSILADPSLTAGSQMFEIIDITAQATA